ncbi:MAG: type III-B CRISPR module RAMP protein Cmr1 [Pseudomonadota bacterium]|nr:type III-B CRISPR module RAMP protein Cmr1 [Pseudomonadota bacterium]
MRETNVLEAAFRVVTPMFLGGAKPDDRAELRVSPIKAALRFWWRAITWRGIRSAQPANSAAIAELRRQEAALFGSADGGQSQVLLRIKRYGNVKVADKGSVLDNVVNRPGARYLGYGVMVAPTGQLTRSCVIRNAEFTLAVRSRRSIHHEVVNSLKLLVLLGGLGSRARKGYGSLTLIGLAGGDTKWEAPATDDSFVSELRSLLSAAAALADEPPFSAFSKESRVCLLLDGNDPLAVLDTYGRQMQRYRSWGKDGKVSKLHSEENFESDHAWAKGTRPKDFHPERVVFGLPHNYGQGSNLQVRPEHYDRRASPLWFHVHDYGPRANPRYAGIATVLRAEFLPDSEPINAGRTPVTAKPDYGVIDKFFNGCVGHRDAKTTDKYFPAAREVFP